MPTSQTLAITSPSFCKNSTLVEAARQLCPSLILNSSGAHLKEEELLAFLQGASLAIVGTEKITHSLLSQLPHLQVVSKYGVGLDNIDFTAFQQLKRTIVYASGVNRRSVSELTLCFMLGILRNVFRTTRLLAHGHWDKDGGTQLTGKTIGIVGLGNIGQDLALLLKPFGCRILANDIADRSSFATQNQVTLVTLQELFLESDIVTLHVPLTPQTQNMIDQPELDLLKKTAVLINTARGTIVNESALKNTLLARPQFFAALDVYAEEPVRDQSLYSLPNIITSPHIGGNAREAVLAMGLAAVDLLKPFIRAPA